MLDVQQLFTKTKSRFLESLYAVPSDAVMGFHIHAKHRAPTDDDPIPWRNVFEWIRSIDHPVLVNPEVHHGKQVPETIHFCRKMLGDPQAGSDACRLDENA